MMRKMLLTIMIVVSCLMLLTGCGGRNELFLADSNDLVFQGDKVIMSKQLFLEMLSDCYDVPE